MSKAAQKKEKHECAIEKRKLYNARRLRGIYFIDPEDGEYMETIQNAEKKLETPEAAMPCELRTTKRPRKPLETDSETKGSNNIFQKTKHAAHESTTRRLESTLPKDHEDHTAGKGYNSMSHKNLVHKFIPMPRAMKIQDATAAADKEWEKLETIPAWNLDNVKSQRKVTLEAQ